MKSQRTEMKKVFIQLKRDLDTFANYSFNDEHEFQTLQAWKLSATSAIDEAFEGIIFAADVRKKIQQLFSGPPPGMGINNTFISVQMTDEENSEMMRHDISEGKAIMDECVSKLNDLHKQFM